MRNLVKRTANWQILSLGLTPLRKCYLIIFTTYKVFTILKNCRKVIFNSVTVLYRCETYDSFYILHFWRFYILAQWITIAAKKRARVEKRWRKGIFSIKKSRWQVTKGKKKLFLMQIDDTCDSTFFDDFLEVRKRGSKRQSWLEEVGREAFHRMHDRRGWYRGRRMEQGEGSKLCTGNTNIPLLPTSSFYANKFPQ